MRAITIQQPYASLIINPPWVKRVENRSWPTAIRGTIAIHAGKGRNWLRTLPEDEWPDPMPFGAVLGTVELVDCVRFDELEAWAAAGPDRDWILTDPHASGPFCWILENARPFPAPVPASGAQGFWQWTPEADRGTELPGARAAGAANG